MLFINCADHHSTGLFKPFFPVSIPYGIAYLMSQLRQKQLPFQYIDQQITPVTISAIASYVQSAPGIPVICLSSLSEASSGALQLSATIKKHFPQTLIILGGLHASILPEEILQQPTIDYVFRGEGETVIADIAEALLNGGDIHGFEGIGFRNNGGIHLNPLPALVNSLDEIPMLPYDLFDQTRYDFGYIGTSRGCPYNCTFCCNNLMGSQKYRAMSPERIVEELDVLINKYHQNDITFFDDNFLSQKNRIVKLCGLIRERGLDKKSHFMFQARARDASKELLTELYHSGFRTVFFGIEAASEKLLQDIGKKETLEEIHTAIANSRALEYKVMANFLYALPGETLTDRMACVEMARKEKIDVVKFNNVVPYPGTAIYDEFKDSAQFHMSPLRQNINSQMVLVKPFWKKIIFPLLPENTSHRELRTDLLLSYFAVYFNFYRIKKIFSDKKWGGVVFRFGSSNAEALKKIPRGLLLFVDLSVKMFLLFFEVLFSKKPLRRKVYFRTWLHFYRKEY